MHDLRRGDGKIVETYRRTEAGSSGYQKWLGLLSVDDLVLLPF